MVGDEVAVMLAGRIAQADAPDRLWRYPASRAVARFLGHTAFVDAAEAAALGWRGELPPGHVLGLGPGSLVSDPAGVALPVVDEGYVLGHVQIGVRLPGGQRAVVVSEHRADAPQLRVRLAGGAITPDDGPDAR